MHLSLLILKATFIKSTSFGKGGEGALYLELGLPTISLVLFYKILPSSPQHACFCLRTKNKRQNIILPSYRFSTPST
ncbi:hypothetical protein BKH43_02160 [Helicobacter sp. 13S00401-1]|nr:hypothetical protein BKH43_02160 [Helicobacter sp. 13S00401-1]